jgi:hypothetical protein
MRRALLAIISALVAAPAAALASPGWTPPGDYGLPANALAQFSKVTYQTGGTATLAYIEVVSSAPLQTVLHVGTIAPGGAYHEQLRLPSTSTAVPVDVGLAEAPNGAAVVEWASLMGQDPHTAVNAFQASYRAAGTSTWGSPATIVTDTVNSFAVSEFLVPAVSPRGDAAAGVQHIDPSAGTNGSRLDVAVHPLGGAWDSGTRISPPHKDSSKLSLGFDAAGNLTAAFQSVLTASQYGLFSARRTSSNGVWTSAADISGDDVTSDVVLPRLAVAANGSALIAFQYVHSGAPHTDDVNVVTRSGSGGAWSSVVDAVPGGVSSVPTAVGLAPNDRAYVVYNYQGSNSGLDCVGVVRAVIGGAWSPHQCASQLNFDGSESRLAFLGNDAYILLNGQAGGVGKSHVEGSRWLDASGSPDAEIDLEPPASTFSIQELVPDLDGSVAAFWTGGTANILRVAVFDAGGPNLTSASVPGSGTSGKSLSMNVTFVDLWSGIGAVSWNFGDGSSASGLAVRHAYAKAGSYTVSVTAADKLGNPTTQRFTVRITPPRPALSKVSQAAKKWSERRQRGVHRGTTFRFTLNGSAKVTLTFVNRRGHKLGSISVKGHTGRNSVRFSGRLSRHHSLGPGRYKVRLVAVAAGGLRSTTKTLSFQIVA